MTAAMRVLLVDDEPRIVTAIQRLLRPHREKWDVSVATSGDEALALMAAAPFDAVISDMRMPVMDGATFLGIAREKYPATMRVVLSGQTDAETTRRVLPIAHQFLSKPTERTELLATLERVVMLHAEIDDPKVREAIGGVDALPTLPAVCAELGAVLAKEQTTVADIARVVEGEPAIVAKLLQVVNSPFFGARRRIASVTDAVAYLGTDQLETIVLAVAMVSALPPRTPHFDAKAFSEHSVAVARRALQIPEGRELADTSFAAGLLHDVGKLAMAATMPALYDRIASKCQESGLAFEEAEIELGSCGHARIGATLLELWGLPFDIVEAVLRHGAPVAQEGGTLRAADAVYLAQRLIGASAATFDNDADRAYLGRIGQLERLPVLLAIGA